MQHFWYYAADVLHYAEIYEFFSRALLTTRILMLNNLYPQNFMKVTTLVKKLCNMLQIAKNAAMLQ